MKHSGQFSGILPSCGNVVRAVAGLIVVALISSAVAAQDQSIHTSIKFICGTGDRVASYDEFATVKVTVGGRPITSMLTSGIPPGTQNLIVLLQPPPGDRAGWLVKEIKFLDVSDPAQKGYQTFTPNKPDANVPLNISPRYGTSISRLEITIDQCGAPTEEKKKLLQLVPLGNVVPSVRNNADPFTVYPGDKVEVTGVVWATEGFDGMFLKYPQNIATKVEISQGVATKVQTVSTDAQGYYDAEYLLLDQDNSVIVVKAISPDPNRYADGQRVYDIDLKKRGTLSVTLATDKAVYAPGETVTVSGNVLADGKPIGALIAPRSDIFPLLSLMTGDGSFRFSFVPGTEPKRNLVGPFQNGLHVASALATGVLGYENGQGFATYLVEQSLTCTSLSAQVVDMAGVAHVRPIDPNSVQMSDSIKASIIGNLTMNTNTKLMGGLKVQTEKGSRVALRFEGEQGATATVAIADSTTMQILAFCKDKNDGRIKAVLVIDGPGQVVINQTDTGNVFSNLDLAVVTRGARVKSIHTRYFVGVDSQGTTTVGALEGTVRVGDPNGANGIDVPPGKQISVQGNQPPNRSPVMPITGKLDPRLDSLLTKAAPPRGNAFPPLVSGRISPPVAPGTPTPSPGAIDLTGLWLDNTGGGAVYRVRQVANKLYWTVDAGPGGSINVYVGDISGNTINGVWVDLPQSSTYLTGNLHLRIDSNDHLVKVGESPCCYGAQEWRRQGTTASAQLPPTGGSPGGGAGGGAAPGPGTTPAPAPGAGGGGPSPLMPPPAAGGGGAIPAPAAPIEWKTNAKAWRGKNGQHIPFTCPPNGAFREIWGTDIYTDDSPICVAAVHKGLITFEKGGLVTIEILPGQPGYTKSERNGVKSSQYPSLDGSYKFVANDVVGLFQRGVPPAAQGGWDGTWVGTDATYTITRSGNSITAVTHWQGDRKPVHEDNGQWTNCKVNANTATCDWRSTYQDPDKTVARKGTLKMTLSGDRITGEQLEDEPVFTWRVSPYSSSIRKGAQWPLNLARKK